MSLRSFHIVFILFALGLMLFLILWSGERLLRGEDGQARGLMIFALSGLAAGIPYLRWFLRKIH